MNGVEVTWDLMRMYSHFARASVSAVTGWRDGTFDCNVFFVDNTYTTKDDGDEPTSFSNANNLQLMRAAADSRSAWNLLGFAP